MMFQESLRAAALVEIAANSVWVGALVAAAVALTLRVYAPVSASARYRVWFATLAAVALVPAALSLARLPAAAPAAVVAASEARVANGPSAAGTGVDESLIRAAPPAAHADTPLDLRVPREFPLETIAIAIVSLVAAVTLFRLGRVVRGALWCARARRDARPLPGDVEARLEGWLRVRDAGRRARVLVTTHAAQPMAIGFRDPAVVLPASLLDALSEEDVDNIVLHEIAHLRRADDWALLAQRVLEALCAFNPVVAWVSRRLDAERELACDEWVVEVTRTPCEYAKSLLRLAELRLTSTRASLAPGALQQSHLARRVESLLRIGSGGRRRAAAWIAAAVAAATFAGGAWLAPTVRVSEAAAPATPDTSMSEPAPAASERLKPLRAGTLRVAAAAAIARDDASRDDKTARSAAIAALGDNAGTVIVMDPKSGHVLTIVNQEWAIRRTFSPASTMKLVTAIAGLRTDTLDPSAKVEVPDSRAKLSLDEALAYSNNPYFADAGERVGLQALVENARLVGYGQPTGIDLVGEVSGGLPDPQTAEPRAVGGFGEGFEITPIQLAVFTSAIANGGLLLEPRYSASPRPFPVVRQDLAEARPALARLLPGMLGAVQYGTARPAFDPTFPIAGKTGTFNADGYSVGIFASFEATSPRYMVLVLIAGKDVMGHDAARVAARVYKKMGC